MIRHDEERLAELLRALPPAPRGWVQAAQELPRVKRELDSLVARAEADEQFRRELIADLERALSASGIEPRARVVEELRQRLA